jgi:hypothetical protein
VVVDVRRGELVFLTTLQRGALGFGVRARWARAGVQVWFGDEVLQPWMGMDARDVERALENRDDKATRARVKDKIRALSAFLADADRRLTLRWAPVPEAALARSQDDGADPGYVEEPVRDPAGAAGAARTRKMAWVCFAME